AINLLTRAAALIVDDRQRAAVLMAVADSQAVAGDLDGAMRVYAETEAIAGTSGDDSLALRAKVDRSMWEMMTDPSADEDRPLALADRLEMVATETGDKWGRVTAEDARAQVFLNHCQWTENLAALERAKALMEPNEDSRIWRK